jgi:hypothetical protein
MAKFRQLVMSSQNSQVAINCVAAAYTIALDTGIPSNTAALACTLAERVKTTCLGTTVTGDTHTKQTHLMQGSVSGSLVASSEFLFKILSRTDGRVSTKPGVPTNFIDL